MEPPHLLKRVEEDAESAGESLLMAAVADPNQVVPKAFDFDPYRPSLEGKEKKEKKEKAEEPQQHLPHRLRIGVFSTSIGHRPMGLQVAQCKLYTTRFLKEFRLASMQKFILGHLGGLPYVTPQNHIPCPALSTINALKWLEMHPETVATGEQQAVEDMRSVFDKGVQVEWKEFPSFVMWQLYCEGASLQSSVQVSPHILDTAFKFLAFVKSRQAAVLAETQDKHGQDEISAEEAFVKGLQGQAVHRLRDAKTLLHGCEAAALIELGQWRKSVLYVYANSLAQHWFFSPAWVRLKNIIYDMGDGPQSLQHTVVLQVTQTIEEGEINWVGDVPKLKKVTVNMDTFTEMCESAFHALKFMLYLQEKYQAVWHSVSSAQKLFRRLVVRGERGLQQAFLRGLRLAGEKVAHLDFKACEPESDIAEVLNRLDTALDTMVAKAEKERAEEAKKAADRDAAAKQMEAKEAKETKTEMEAEEAKDKGAFAETQGRESLDVAKVLPQQQQGEAKATEGAKEKLSPEDSAINAIMPSTRLQAEDILTLFEGDLPKHDLSHLGLCVLKEDRPAGTLFIVPTAPASRGRPQKTGRPGQACSGSALAILRFFRESDALLVSLGHDPEAKANTRKHLTKLVPQNKILESLSFSIVPVFQRSRSLQYVEYYMMAIGPQYPCEGKLAWVGPHPLVVDNSTKVRRCPEQCPCQDAGPRLCEATEALRDHFTRPLPRIVKQPQSKSREMAADLLGGLSHAADAESAHESDSTISEGNAGDNDDDDDDAVEGMHKERAEKALATPQGPVSGKLWALRGTRQGMTVPSWMALLQPLSPSKVVLVGYITFQAGLISAMLRYNDRRFGLGLAHLVAFCPTTPSEQSSSRQKKQFESAHLAYHTIEAGLRSYAQFRVDAGAVTHSSILGKRPALSTLVGQHKLRKLTGHNSEVSVASEGISALDKSQGQQDGTEQTLPEVANFITLGWNITRKELLPRFCDSQADEPDSDDPDKDSPCDKVEQQSLSKRNSCFFAKHPVTVQYISKQVAQGLVATEDLPKGVTIPCKGPWFRSLHQMRQWLGQLHPDTCKMFLSRVVRLDLKSSTPDSNVPDMLYKVITNPCGFLNHYRHLGKINCKLEWQDLEPLGQRSLILRTTAKITKGQQLLLNYGSLYHLRGVQEKLRKGIQKSKKKAAARIAGNKETQDTESPQENSLDGSPL